MVVQWNFTRRQNTNDGYCDWSNNEIYDTSYMKQKERVINWLSFFVDRSITIYYFLYNLQRDEYIDAKINHQIIYHRLCPEPDLREVSE